MMIEKGRISTADAVTLMAAFIIGSSTLFGTGGTAGRDAWLATTIGMAEGLVFAAIYVALLNRFPRQNLIQIIDTVFGRYLGSIISFMMLLYLTHLTSLVLGNYRDFLKDAFLINTPQSVVLLSLMLVIIYGVRKGLEVFSRIAPLFIVGTTAAVLFATSLLIPQFRLENLLPIARTPLPRLLWSAHGVATFPFGETVAFTMILPYVRASRRTGRIILSAFAIAGPLLIFLAARGSMVLGAAAQLFIFPSFQLLKLIDVGEIFTRMELILAISYVLMGYLKTVCLAYASTLGFAQLFRLKSYTSLIFPVGMITTLLAVVDARNVAETVTFAVGTYPLYALPFQLVIPLLTLVVAAIRRKRGASDADLRSASG